MQLVDYKELQKNIIGTAIPKPILGTLSGHAAGEPFDKLVYKEIKNKYPKHTFRQYEYLNDLYSKNPQIIGHAARYALFDSPTVMFLLSRGKNVTDKWTSQNIFEEKQNDTADILVVKNDFYEIIDIKTRNISKSAQAPNIISSYKLAQVCAKMIDNEEFSKFSLNYFGLDWLLKDDKLVCQKTHYANLFLANPTDLYINWAAAMQIQFDVSNLDQNYKQDNKQWAKEHLKHFTIQARRRAKDMLVKFVEPFEKYIH